MSFRYCMLLFTFWQALPSLSVRIGFLLLLLHCHRHRRRLSIDILIVSYQLHHRRHEGGCGRSWKVNLLRETTDYDKTKSFGYTSQLTLSLHYQRSSSMIDTFKFHACYSFIHWISRDSTYSLLPCHWLSVHNGRQKLRSLITWLHESHGNGRWTRM
jgi:hypothetical protein